MIKYKTGDLFSADVDAIVNSVNCVGVMGRGLALQFKKTFPENFKAYAAACRRNEVQPGKMFVYETNELTGPRYIINFPTKRHWRGKSRIEDIEDGLISLAAELRSRKIRSVGIPPLGTDLGGLRWDEVRPRIESALQDLDDVKVVLFQPGSAPSDGRRNISTNVPRMSIGRAVLVCLIARYFREPLDPFVTLLEVHKLMYFMEKAGQPLRLAFKKGPYGPYSENLRHVLRKIEGHLVTGYHFGGDDPRKPLELVPGAIADADEFLKDRSDIRDRLDKVSDLIEGFESNFGLELLATVHWIIQEHQIRNQEDVVFYTHSWGPRKRQFSARQIRLARDVLRKKGWI